MCMRGAGEEEEGNRFFCTVNGLRYRHQGHRPGYSELWWWSGGNDGGGWGVCVAARGEWGSGRAVPCQTVYVSRDEPIGLCSVPCRVVPSTFFCLLGAGRVCRHSSPPLMCSAATAQQQ
jgi:hypothetical protein